MSYEYYEDLARQAGDKMEMAYLKDYDVDVCENGDIFNARTGRKYRATKDRVGYLRITLTKPDGKRTGLSVHRAVALAFLENPENKPDVNHLNGIKSDCRLENLEWATRGENMKHAKDMGLWNSKMRNKHIEPRNKIIVNLFNNGVSREIIETSFEINRPNLNRIIRDAETLTAK